MHQTFAVTRDEVIVAFRTMTPVHEESCETGRT